jgi:hypothetical protein
MDEHISRIMFRLDDIEKNIEGIASFLRSKSSTLGEAFPDLQHQKVQDERSQEIVE